MFGVSGFVTISFEFFCSVVLVVVLSVAALICVFECGFGIGG